MKTKPLSLMMMLALSGVALLPAASADHGEDPRVLEYPQCVNGDFRHHVTPYLYATECGVYCDAHAAESDPFKDTQCSETFDPRTLQYGVSTEDDGSGDCPGSWQFAARVYEVRDNGHGPQERTLVVVCRPPDVGPPEDEFTVERVSDDDCREGVAVVHYNSFGTRNEIYRVCLVE